MCDDDDLYNTLHYSQKSTKEKIMRNLKYYVAVFKTLGDIQVRILLKNSCLKIKV